MTGDSPTPLRSRPLRRSTPALAMALTALVAGIGLWLGGTAAPAAAAGPCELGDLVWHDRNGNALQDDFEEGVPGVTVTVFDIEEQPVSGVDPVITGADGEYLFDDLACGEYVVKFDTNSRDGGSLTGTKKGNDPTRDSNPAQRGSDTRVGWTDPVVLTEDDPADLTIDAGILVDLEECAIGDFVWSDENENGLQDEGEPGIPDVVVRLLTGNGEPSGYDPATTDAQGRYAFPEIGCDQYILQFRVPTGATITKAEQGDDRAKDSNITAWLGGPEWAEAGVSVGTNDFDPVHRSDRTVDAGFVLPDEPVPPQCWIGDFVWGDTDGDGIQDPGERAGLATKVELISQGTGKVVDATEPDSNGKYLLVANCGTYRVRFSGLIKGYEFTRQNAGEDPAKDSDADRKTGLTRPVTVTAKASFDRTVDAGVRKIKIAPPGPTPTATPQPSAPMCGIGGVVWNDADTDGKRDEGEDLFADVRVALIDADGDVVAKATTDVGGRYAMRAACGTYRVRFSGLPAGYEFADPASGVTAPVTLSEENAEPRRNAAVYSPTGELPDTGSAAALPWVLAAGVAGAALGGLLLITRRRRLG